MNLNVTQNNLYLFLPSKVSWMTDMLTADNEMSIVEAIKKIYSSTTYAKMENEESKLWHLGPVALYYDLINESAPHKSSCDFPTAGTAETSEVDSPTNS